MYKFSKYILFFNFILQTLIEIFTNVLFSTVYVFLFI